MNHTKVYQADLDFHCQELSNVGLGFVGTFLVHSRIEVLCARTGKAIHLFPIWYDWANARFTLISGSLDIRSSFRFLRHPGTLGDSPSVDCLW